MAVEMKIQIRQTSPSASEATIRHHQIPIDRPVAKGGTDAGPMGGELFLAAVGGCFTSNLLAAINAREVGISDVRVEVVGTLTDAPARFTALELRIAANNASASPETLEKLVEIADRGCIMMNTLRGSLDIKLVVGGPSS
jgi:putative redox protein